MKRITLFLGIGLILLLAGAVVYQFASPRIVSLQPEDVSEKVPPGTGLRMTFSRQMNHESVEQRFQITPFIRGSFSWEDRTMIFNPEGGWAAGTQIQVTLPPGATAAGFLPLPMREMFQASFRVSQPRLAYLYPSTGLANLYAIQPETGEIESLVDFPSGILDFMTDWEGQVIYYSGRNAAGGSDLYRFNLFPQSQIESDTSSEGEMQPSEPVKILECQQKECRVPAISPSGQHLAFEQTNPITAGGLGIPQVMLLPLLADGRPAGEPFHAGDETHQTLLPIWSPNGWLVFYDSSVVAYIFVDPLRGEIASLPNESGEIGCWSPDGSTFIVPQFYYIDETLPGGETVVGPVINSRLIAFRPEDGLTTDLSRAENLEDMFPSFSPDGYNLAFARRYIGISQWTPGKQLWIMPFTENAPAGSAFPISNDPYYTHYDFVWSPDSNRLAYVRFNQTTLTEPPEIWYIDPLNLEGKQLIIGGNSPLWIP